MENTICLQKAKDWTEAWRAQKGTFTDHTDLKAFLIPLADLQEAMAEPTVVNIRAYIGVDKNDNNQPHLIIVGVDEAGNDIILPEARLANCEEENQRHDLDTGLYDFSQPCPNTCDTSSPLFSSKNP